MTSRDRQELGDKLDWQLAQYLHSLERKRHHENWSEDMWENELARHPFVVQNTPQSSERAQLVEDLARLMYEPIGETRIDRAKTYKQDGLFSFQRQHYRMAILSFTEGIKQRSMDAELNADLYLNRAIAHFNIRNYRSALYDCEKALTFKPIYQKARLFAAKAALQVSMWDVCIAHCLKFLELQPTSKCMMIALNTARKKKFWEERHMPTEMIKSSVLLNNLVRGVIGEGARAVKLDFGDDPDWMLLSEGKDVYVHKRSGLMKRCVSLYYPETGMTEIVHGCLDDMPFLAQLQSVYPAPWDKENKYKLGNISFYIVQGIDKEPHLVYAYQTLSDLMKENTFVFHQDALVFMVMPIPPIMDLAFLEKEKDTLPVLTESP